MLDVGLTLGLCHGGTDTHTHTGTRASAATGTDTCRNACADPGTRCCSANYPAATSCCAAQRVGSASATG